MENLEKFKFATIHNLSIKVEEKDDEIMVDIEPVEVKEIKATAKKININYHPLESYNRGDFNIKDDHHRIEIEREYAVGNYDDIDYEIENVYPCDTCARKQDWIRKLETKVENLKGIINKLID